MNDSLAKQLHDLVKTCQINIAEQVIDTIRAVNLNVDTLEIEVNKLIENNKNVGKENE